MMQLGEGGGDSGGDKGTVLGGTAVSASDVAMGGGGEGGTVLGATAASPALSSDATFSVRGISHQNQPKRKNRNRKKKRRKRTAAAAELQRPVVVTEQSATTTEEGEEEPEPEESSGARKEEEGEDFSEPRNDGDESSEGEDEGKEGYVKGGYHPVQLGELYNRRYKVVKKLGWGHFSTVWLSQDIATDRHIALKIVKSAPDYTEAALDEIEILKQIAAGNPNNDKCVIHLVDHFYHRGPHGKHVCMGFEVLGESLLDLIKRTNYRGLPLPVVKRIAKQVLIGLDYLHTQLSIIHTDIKPENVLLVKSPPGSRPASQASSKVIPSVRSSAAQTTAKNHPTQKLSQNQKRKQRRRKKQQLTQQQPSSPSVTKQEQERADGTGASDTIAEESPESVNVETECVNEQLEEKPAEERLELGDGDEEERDSEEDVDRYLPSDPSFYNVKIVDFGNACWTHKHFTNDIQTRQYRSLEAILHASYSTPVDIWSTACMIFELATGDLLFEPRAGKSFDKSDDHLAQFMETLGPIPKTIALRGKLARNYFNRQGKLKFISQLHYWPLEAVLMEKYHFTEEEAQAMGAFLRPMLNYDPKLRATASQCLAHSWLAGVE
ncbi:Serine/threonine protein kinase, CMGC group [Balamuthia mandrillaris]